MNKNIKIKKLGAKKIFRILKNVLPKRMTQWVFIQPAIQNIQYHLRYKLVFRKKLQKQLSSTKRDVKTIYQKSSTRILVPLIETSHYQYLQILILAKALQIRGAKIKLLICGQSLDGCELKSIRNENTKDPCWKCRFNELNVLPLFKLDTVRLNDIISKEEVEGYGREAKSLVISGCTHPLVRHGVDLTQCIDDSVIRYFYGAVPNDVNIVNKVRENHTKTALMSIEVAKRIDEIWSPHKVLNNMPCYSAWESYYRYYRSHGTRFIQIALSAFNFRSIVFNSFQLFPALDRFEKYIESRQHLKLRDEEKMQLEKFINNRCMGNAEIFLKDKYFTEVFDSAALNAKFKIDHEKRKIFLFANLYWDVGLSERGAVFTSVIDWVIETIELLKREPSCHLYIKPHPAEVSASSRKGISQIIKEKYPQLPSNVTIIEAEWKINTYQLFPLIDVGVIFTGTLGLEMMLAGIPVVSTGSTTHQGLGFAMEPETIYDYRAALIGANKAPEIDRDKLDLFAYFYFIRTLLPWRLTKKAYGNSEFDGFTIESLEDLEPGRDPYLDHICDCILDPENTIVEGWK